MSKSKYIIFIDATGMELPVVFNPILNHSGVTVAGFKPISAGFCSLAKYEPYYEDAYGESVSLKLKSRGEVDREIINRYLQYDC